MAAFSRHKPARNFPSPSLEIIHAAPAFFCLSQLDLKVMWMTKNLRPPSFWLFLNWAGFPAQYKHSSWHRQAAVGKGPGAKQNHFVQWHCWFIPLEVHRKLQPKFSCGTRCPSRVWLRAQGKKKERRQLHSHAPTTISMPWAGMYLSTTGKSTLPTHEEPVTILFSFPSTENG